VIGGFGGLLEVNICPGKGDDESNGGDRLFWEESYVATCKYAASAAGYREEFIGPRSHHFHSDER